MNIDHQICKVIRLKSPEEAALEISCSLSIQVLILVVFFFLVDFKGEMSREIPLRNDGIREQALRSLLRLR